MRNFLVELTGLYNDMAPYLFIGLFFAGLLHITFKKDFIVKHLGNNSFWSVVKAAILGVPLPLCSCGVIPTAFYLRKKKASEGATVSFLISTPETGIDSIIATYGMMGPVFAIFRPLVAFFSGIVGGLITNKLVDKLEIKNEVISQKGSCTIEHIPHSLTGKMKEGFRYAFVDFLDDISGHLLVGILIAAVISFIIPDNFFGKLGNNNFVDMLIMALIGIPLYVCATGSIPIAVSLMMKGISPGAAFVFLVAGPATNAATMTMIANVMGKKLLAVYLAVIVVMAFLGGFLLDGIYSKVGMEKVMHHIHNSDSDSIFMTVLMILFSFAFLLSLYRKVKSRFSGKLKEVKVSANERIFTIEGMTCNHCLLNVKKAISEINGVEAVEISLADKKALVKGSFDPIKVKEIIEKIGYKVEIK